MWIVFPPFKKKHKGKLNNLCKIKQLGNMELGFDYRKCNSRALAFNHYLVWVPPGQKKIKARVTR